MHVTLYGLKWLYLAIYRFIYINAYLHSITVSEKRVQEIGDDEKEYTKPEGVKGGNGKEKL